MSRALLLVLDSFGIGATKDASHYGDEGANTFLHIAQAYQQLNIPNLTALGLNEACHQSCGEYAPLKNPAPNIIGAYGYAEELSCDKDTPSGHWEITGVPVTKPWGHFPKTIPCFPDALTDKIITQAQLPGLLGNKHASGTDIINELGLEHMQSGKPIVYTSADSVFQIAAHEESFGLDKLYELCHLVRELVDTYQIGRVIARPFIGEPGNFTRTGNRRDISLPPPAPTLLNRLSDQGFSVYSIGKIADIFAHQGITHKIKANGNDMLFTQTLDTLKTAPDNSLIFTNFVDFDMLYGHRRDVTGYAKALEAFDQRLPELIEAMQPDDLMIITADHGCDPTWPGSDHTREHIPILMFGNKINPGFIGPRQSFADIGQTLAQYFTIAPLPIGEAFI